MSIATETTTASPHLRAIGGCQEQHPLAPLKPVQLCQQLIQRLIPLLIQAQTTLAACTRAP